MLKVFLFLGTAILLCTACSKSGQPIEQQRRTGLAIGAITVDSLILKIEANNVTLSNSMIAPGTAQIPEIRYTNPAQRFRITNLYTNHLMVDTLLNYTTSSSNKIIFIQPGAGADLVWLGPPVNEPAPPAGKSKVAFLYVLYSMPNEVKVVIENSESGASAYDYVPTDSAILKKGQLSPFFQIWSSSTTAKPRLKAYTSDAARMLIADISNNLFYNLNPGFSVYSFEKPLSGSASVSKLY